MMITSNCALISGVKIQAEHPSALAQQLLDFILQELFVFSLRSFDFVLKVLPSGHMNDLVFSVLTFEAITEPMIAKISRLKSQILKPTFLS